MEEDARYRQEIKEFKEEVKFLKQSKKEQHDPKTEMYRNNINSGKNENAASVFHGGRQENFELKTVINFTEKTVETFSNYREQLKTQLDFNLTQQDK